MRHDFLIFLKFIIVRCKFVLVYLNFKPEGGWLLVLINSDVVKQLRLDQLLSWWPKKRVEFQHLSHHLNQIRVWVWKKLRYAFALFTIILYLFNVVQRIGWCEEAEVFVCVKVIHLFNDLEDVIISRDVLLYAIIRTLGWYWVARVASEELPILDFTLVNRIE